MKSLRPAKIKYHILRDQTIIAVIIHSKKN